MIIKTLVENTSISEKFNCEHGLSFYINTTNHKLLFDLGASELFIENAIKMGVDLTEVDTVVISHGHSDHGGGLKAFLNINSKAKIFLNQKAFDKYFAARAGDKKVYIGLDEEIIKNDRFIFVSDHLIIDEELELYSNVKATRLSPSGNHNLFMKQNNLLVPDDFSHEQNLIIRENGNTILLSGCAHNGIVNIIDHFRSLKNRLPDYVISGFHLYNRSRDESEDPAIISQIGEYLKNTDTMFYTCHCTGIGPYKHLKEIIGENINYLATGSELII